MAGTATGTIFDGAGLQALQARLQWLQVQQHATADNLANAETPGYHAVEAAPANFGDALARALAQGPLALALTAPRMLPAPRSAGAGTPALVPEPGGAMKANGNTVAVDAEMARLARNGMWFAAASKQLSMAFLRLEAVISEGSQP